MRWLKGQFGTDSSIEAILASLLCFVFLPVTLPFVLLTVLLVCLIRSWMYSRLTGRYIWVVHAGLVFEGPFTDWDRAMGAVSGLGLRHGVELSQELYDDYPLVRLRASTRSEAQFLLSQVDMREMFDRREVRVGDYLQMRRNLGLDDT